MEVAGDRTNVNKVAMNIFEWIFDFQLISTIIWKWQKLSHVMEIIQVAEENSENIYMFVPVCT